MFQLFKNINSCHEDVSQTFVEYINEEINGPILWPKSKKKQKVH